MKSRVSIITSALYTVMVVSMLSYPLTLADKVWVPDDTSRTLTVEPDDIAQEGERLFQGARWIGTITGDDIKGKKTYVTADIRRGRPEPPARRTMWVASAE